MRLAEASGEFANDAHGPVLYLLLLQNRELSFANSVRASRLKETVMNSVLIKRDIKQEENKLVKRGQIAAIRKLTNRGRNGQG